MISVPSIAHLNIHLLLLVGRFDHVERGILDDSHLRFFTARTLPRLLGYQFIVLARPTAGTFRAGNGWDERRPGSRGPVRER